MTDLIKLKEILDKDGLRYHETEIYGADNVKGYALWLENGHIEFDANGKLENIVNWR